MKIIVETTKTYTVEFTEEDVDKLYSEIGEIKPPNGVPYLQELRALLDNP